jgi:hypothetical protein
MVDQIPFVYFHQIISPNSASKLIIVQSNYAKNEIALQKNLLRPYYPVFATMFH